MTESPVLGKVREQFADLEQSSLKNDNFLGAHLACQVTFYATSTEKTQESVYATRLALRGMLVQGHVYA